MAICITDTRITQETVNGKAPAAVISDDITTATILVCQNTALPVPDAPESEVEPELAPSTRPKRRRGKRGGVRSETARRRKNAERAELRAYDLNVDDEEDR